MFSAVAVRSIHIRPCGTPGENGVVAIFKKWLENVQQGWRCSRGGDASMNMYSMLMPSTKLLTQAVDESRGHVPPWPLLGGSAIDKPIVDAAASLATGAAQWQVADISDSSQGDTTLWSLQTRGSAAIVSLFHRCEAYMWLDTGRLDWRVLKLMCLISFSHSSLSFSAFHLLHYCLSTGLQEHVCSHVTYCKKGFQLRWKSWYPEEEMVPTGFFNTGWCYYAFTFSEVPITRVVN